MAKNENVENIDSVIEKYSVGWKLSRISKVALAVLRLAVCEILYFDDIPPVVSVSEATGLARKYSTETSADFVNGVLSGVINK